MANPIELTNNVLVTIDNNKNYNPKVSILVLPREVLAHIFSFLPFQKFPTIRRVCKLFNAVAMNYRHAFDIGVDGPDKLKQALGLTKTGIKTSAVGIKWLIEVQKVDPSVNDNYAIQIASARGYLEIVKLLLVDSRVDPSANNNFAITAASRNGHAEVIKLLLTDTRVDPSDLENLAIRWASDAGHIEAVKVLLANSRIDPSADNNDAIRRASYNAHAEIVKLLLADKRVPNGCKKV